MRGRSLTRLRSQKAQQGGGRHLRLSRPVRPCLARPGQRGAALHAVRHDRGDVGLPNRVYDPTTGTLTVRRTITNNSGTALTALEVQLTSLITAGGTPPPPASQAVLMAVSPTGGETVNNGTTNTPIATMTLVTPTNSSGQGGLGSIWSVTLPSGGLAAGHTVSVDLVFHVAQGGHFSFGYNILAPTG